MIFTHLLLFLVGVVTAERPFTLMVKPTGVLKDWYSWRVENLQKLGLYSGFTVDLSYEDVGPDVSPGICIKGAWSGGDPVYMIDAEGKLHSLPSTFRNPRAGNKSLTAGGRPSHQASKYPGNQIMYRLEFFSDAELEASNLAGPNSNRPKTRFDIEVLTRWTYQEIADKTIEGEPRSFVLGLDREGAGEVETRFYLCEDGERHPKVARVYHLIPKEFRGNAAVASICQPVMLEMTWLPDEKEEDSTDEDDSTDEEDST